MKTRTLNLSEQLFGLGQNYLRFGRDDDALEVFTRLIKLGELTTPIAEQVQAHLAEIHIRRGRYHQARRHLNVALARDPDNARFHHLMAQAILEDDYVDPERALFHLRQAVEQEPDSAEFRSDYGVCLINVGEVALGLDALEAAAHLAGEDLYHLRWAVKFMAEEGEFSRARRLVLNRLFQDPDDSRIRQVWDELRFREARWRQVVMNQRAGLAEETVAKVLPFQRVATRPSSGRELSGEHIIRIDQGSPQAPHLPHGHRRRQSR